MYFRHHNTSHIRRLMITPRVCVITILYRMDMANLCPSVVLFSIPMYDYVCVRLLPSQFFILCIYIGIDHFFMDSTSSKSTTLSLVEGGTISRVSMCFHTMINSCKLINNYPCRFFVKKYANMGSVMQ